MESTTYFSAKDINDLRRKASKQCVDPRHYPEGWSKSKMCPMKVLKAFPSLQIKKGYVLRAYQFISGSNGNGIVWAMPEDSVFPEPEECSKSKDSFPSNCPMPEDALENVMDIIEGDGSNLSYISASILAREISEFGACWHGCSWSSHTILDDQLSCDEFTLEEMDDWDWHEEKPNEWRSSVQKIKNKVVVTFYTYTGFDRAGIVRHSDTFSFGSYCFTSDSTMVAESGRRCVY